MKLAGDAGELVARIPPQPRQRMHMIRKTPDAFWASIKGVNPEPWESPQTSIGYRKGKPFVHHRSTARHRLFKESVADEFRTQNPDWPNFGESSLDVTFFLWREVVSYEDDETGRMKRGRLVDATNCQKALEDALQGVLYDNDVNNLRIQTHIVEQGVTVQPFILIKIGFAPIISEEVLTLAKELGLNDALFEGSIVEELGPERDIF